jgi:hypothetical protein
MPFRSSSRSLILGWMTADYTPFNREHSRANCLRSKPRKLVRLEKINYQKLPPIDSFRVAVTEVPAVVISTGSSVRSRFRKVKATQADFFKKKTASKSHPTRASGYSFFVEILLKAGEDRFDFFRLSAQVGNGIRNGIVIF